MASQLKFDTLSCGADQHIEVVKYIIKLNADETIEFQNKLDGDPVANIQFYPLNHKEPGYAISGFCDGESGDTFQVPGTGNGKRDCKVTESGQFAYSIDAVSHKPLDPVIIIEPNVSIFAFVVTAGVAALIAVSAAYAYGRKQGKKSVAS